MKETNKENKKKISFIFGFLDQSFLKKNQEYLEFCNMFHFFHYSLSKQLTWTHPIDLQ